MTIDQPRLDSYTTDEITVEELRAWGESIKPIAQKAFSGLGEFVPGDHCRFCRGKAQCRARANINTALEDFKDCVPAGKQPQGEGKVLTDAEIGDLLERGNLVQWYKDLEEYATEALLAGKEIPGWKLVAGRSIGPLPTRTPPSRRSLPPVMMRPWSMTASPRPSPSWKTHGQG